MSKNPYMKEYQWSNIAAMLRNNRSLPRTTEEGATGKLTVITGATSGIGYETACLFAAQGSDLICINRNSDRSDRLKHHIESEYGVSCVCFLADFSRLQDIRSCAEFLRSLDRPIDILIHNAGVYNTHLNITVDGIEEVFQVNYLASFMITHALVDTFCRQGHGRILYVNSEGHRFALRGIQLDDLLWRHHRYTGLKSYGSAKTAQLLSLYYFTRRFSSTDVTINAMHPGDVRTQMGENNGRIYRTFKHLFIRPSARDPSLSAQALYYLGVSDEVKSVTGKFYNFTTQEIPAPHALDVGRARQLIIRTLQLGDIDEEYVETDL